MNIIPTTKKDGDQELTSSDSLIQKPIIFFSVLVLIIFSVQLYAQALSLIFKQFVPIENEILYNVIIATGILVLLTLVLKWFNIPIIQLEKISEL